MNEKEGKLGHLKMYQFLVYAQEGWHAASCPTK